jgi:hypothetical protein
MTVRIEYSDGSRLEITAEQPVVDISVDVPDLAGLPLDVAGWETTTRGTVRPTYTVAIRPDPDHPLRMTKTSPEERQASPR